MNHLCVQVGKSRRLLHRLLQVFDGLQQHASLLVELLDLLSQRCPSTLILLWNEEWEEWQEKMDGRGKGQEMERETKESVERECRGERRRMKRRAGLTINSIWDGN